MIIPVGLIIRLGILLFTRRWGWMLAGAAFVAGGGVFGALSHTVSYQTINQGHFRIYLIEGGTDYIQVQSDPSTYYALNESSFTPSFTSSSIPDGAMIAFTYRSDSDNLDVSLTDGTKLSGSSHTIEQITIADSSGQNIHTYSTAEYTQNPNGFYVNNWPTSIGLIVIGLVLGALAFVVPALLLSRKKRLAQATAMGTVGAPVGTPSPMNPYQQPYQGPQQYKEYAANPQYTPQPGQYQPAGPYQPSQAPQYPGYPPQPGQYDPNNPYNQAPRS